MKIIDHTPFISENGQISLIDRAKATLQFGTSWFPEMEAQRAAIAVLGRVLDRSYTLLRNITPPGLGTSIPLILVGPTGAYVMYVTHLRGMYRAKGDEWGTLPGNTFKPSNPNLLTRTARMARAVHVYLQRQGYEGLMNVEAVLLCADPGMHVDSVRPIIRVVMSDALERFAVSVSQARVTLTSEAVHGIVSRIMNPKPVQLHLAGAAIPTEAPAPAPGEPTSEESYVPPFALPESEAAPSGPDSWNAERLGFDFQETASTDATLAEADVEAALLFGIGEEAQPHSEVRSRRRGFTCAQWAMLIVFAVIEIAVVGGLLYFLFYQVR